MHYSIRFILLSLGTFDFRILTKASKVFTEITKIQQRYVILVLLSVISCINFCLFNLQTNLDQDFLP